MGDGDGDGVGLPGAGSVDGGAALGEGGADAVGAGVVNCPLDIGKKVPDGAGPGSRGV